MQRDQALDDCGASSRKALKGHQDHLAEQSIENNMVGTLCRGRLSKECACVLVWIRSDMDVMADVINARKSFLLENKERQ